MFRRSIERTAEYTGMFFIALTITQTAIGLAGLFLVGQTAAEIVKLKGGTLSA